jgi:hypothetical protein
MSAFSFTAPFFSKEEEQAERNALSADEKATIKADVYGSSSDTTGSNKETYAASPATRRLRSER